MLVIGLVKTGVIAPLIENRAIAALNAALPDNLTADIGGSEVIAERFGGIAVNLDKFSVRETLSGRDILEVGRTTIGVKTMSVLRGSPQVDKIALSGVRFTLPAARGDDGEPDTIRSHRSRARSRGCSIRSTCFSSGRRSTVCGSMSISPT